MVVITVSVVVYTPVDDRTGAGRVDDELEVVDGAGIDEETGVVEVGASVVVEVVDTTVAVEATTVATEVG